MKRFAYLLYNNEGLQGVKKDVSDFRAFLESLEGGAWESTEILERPNPSALQVIADIAEIRRKNYDYVLLYYSGHGDWGRGTNLVLKGNDIIPAKSVIGIASKQLSIFDCCRYIPPEASPEKRAFACDEALNSRNLKRQMCREKFDRLISEAKPQQVCLYACKVGEFAIATSFGSLYTQTLLSTAKTLSTSNNADALYVHNICCPVVVNAASRLGRSQHPESEPNSAIVSASLPFAIKPPQLIFG